MGSIRRLSGVTTLTIAALLVLATSGAAERQRTAPPMEVDRLAQQWWGSAGVGVEVRDRDGHPVAGAEVQLAFSAADGGSEGPAAVRTDASGRAAIRGLAEGEWILTIRHPETMAYVATLRVRQGKRPQEKSASQVKVNDSLRPLRLKYFEESGPAAHPMQPASPPVGRERAPAKVPPPVEQAIPAPERPAAPHEEAQPPAAVPQEAPAPEAPPAEPMAAEAPRPEPAEAPMAAEEPMAEPAGGPMAGSEAPPAVPEATAAAPTPVAEPEAPAAEPEAPASEPDESAAASETSAAATEPAMGEAAPEQPMAEPEQPAAEPQPMAEPAPAAPASAPAPAAAPTAVAPRRSTLRSNEAGTCPECRPGEWSVTTEGIAAPGSGTCPDDLKARMNRAAALLGSSRALGPWTGPIEIAGGASSVLGNEAYGQFTEAVREVLADDATCRVLAVMLPAGATFVGLEMAADDNGTWRLCLPGKECVDGSGWTGDPWVVRTPAGPLVVGAYGNGGAEPRRARLTVYFTVPEGWAPR